jgi:Recombinase
MIHRILKNENYIGNIVYNRVSRRLGQKRIKNPRDHWVRSAVVVDPIIDQHHFESAQRIMDDRYLSISEDEMLLRLRLLLKRKGKLNCDVIDRAAGVPSVASYWKHFGSIRRAFALIGYKSPRDCDRIDSQQLLTEVLAAQAAQVVEALTGKHIEAKVAEPSAISVNRKFRICFQIARQSKKRGPKHAASWRVYRRTGLHGLHGLLVVLRLDADNRAIEDFLVLPSAKLTKPYLYFSDQGEDHGAIRAETSAGLIGVIKCQLKGRLRARRKA